jgi:hypothetical protein
MKPPVLNVPENYMISTFSLSQPDAEDWEIWDKNIPNTNGNTKVFPYRAVARICTNPPEMWYWPADGVVSADKIRFDTLDAAVKHFETMVGLGMVGHGYTKGMLNESA